MAYASLLNEEGIQSQYLVVIKPRREFEDDIWSLVSGAIYVQSFSYGRVINVAVEGVAFTEAASSSVAYGEWFYESQTGDVFINFAVNPNGYVIVATYELYFGTFDAHFNRNPLDSATTVVYYEPLITKSPEVQASNTDILFGFLPSSSTMISISNLTQYLQEHLYSSSFNRCDIEVYHWLDELITANVKLVTRGICGSVSSTDQEVSITIFDNNDFFNAEFRQLSALGSSFYTTNQFPNLDPNFQSRPVRKVYGVVDSFIPVNVDYNATTPSTANNRNWSCIKSVTNLGSVQTTVPASPASTTTRTYLTSADGIRVGDTVWIDSSLGSGFDEFVIVTVVNKTGADYIEHLAVTNVAVSTDVVKRNFVGAVTIFKDGVAYTAKYGKHYSEYIDGSNSVSGFTFLSTLEANLGMATLTPLDLVYARVYGNKATVTLGGNPFGSNSVTCGSLSQGVVVFYDLLKTFLGLPETKIDTATFTSLQGTLADEVGFAIPALGQSDFPTFKELFSSLTTTLLLKIFIDDDNKFSITQSGPHGAISKTIADDEILESSFSYNFDYGDVRSDIIVEYAPHEVSTRYNTGEVYYSRSSATNDRTVWLHGITKQETFHSLHYISTEAATLATRLSYALGERRGIIGLTTKNRFFNTEINEVISTSREKLAGFPYVRDTLNNRSSVVIALQKSLDQIVLTLDDQKGIEDNSATW